MHNRDPILKKLSPDEALLKAQSYCAYQERCQQEVRDKLYNWGLWQDVVEKTIALLINDNYLNEERFAKTFAGGKFRIKKWGRVKIKIELKKRKVSEYCIKQALKEINDKAYLVTLKKLIADQSKKIKPKSSIKHNYLLGQYAISKGYEADLVWDVVKKNCGE